MICFKVIAYLFECFLPSSLRGGLIRVERETGHTKRKIQQVIDTEPSSPEAASRGVKGIESSIAVLANSCAKVIVILFALGESVV